MTEPDQAETEDDGRRYPSTIGGLFYLLVLAVVSVALALVVLDEWRTGVRVMGGALIFGALVRLVLRTRDAGMLEAENAGEARLAPGLHGDEELPPAGRAR